MSSNLIQSESAYIGYSLPEGASWSVNLENGKKEGNVGVIDEYGTQIADLVYKMDKLNGVCTFYEFGAISKTIPYVNDVAEGWSCEYDNGEEARCYIYRNGYKVLELHKNNEKSGYWNEIDMQSNKIVCSCQYNANHEKSGIGYVYKDGAIEKAVLFEKGEEVRVLKEFAGDIMSEMDKNGILIYKGGFFNSIALDYPREGNGIELVDGKRDYEGNWRNNKKDGFGVKMKNNFAYYNGNWKNDLPNGEGRIMDQGKVLYKGEWKNGVLELGGGECFYYEEGKARDQNRDPLKVIVRSDNNWSSLSKEVTELVIAEGVYNEMKGDMIIEGLDYLKKIVVKKNSLKNLNSLRICKCRVLEKIETEEETFNNVKKLEITSLIDLIQLILSSSIDNIHCRNVFILLGNIIEFDEFG